MQNLCYNQTENIVIFADANEVGLRQIYYDMICTFNKKMKNKRIIDIKLTSDFSIIEKF